MPFTTKNTTRIVPSFIVLALSSTFIPMVASASENLGKQDWTSGQHIYDNTRFEASDGYTLRFSKDGTSFSGHSVNISGQIGLAVEDKARATISGNSLISGSYIGLHVYGGMVVVGGGSVIQSSGDTAVYVGGGGSLFFDGESGRVIVEGQQIGLGTNSGGSMVTPTTIEGSNVEIIGYGTGLQVINGINRVNLSNVKIQGGSIGLHVSGRGLKAGSQVELNNFKINAVGVGVQSELGGIVHLQNGIIETSSDAGYGIYSQLKDSQVYIDNVSVKTIGNGARGLLTNSDGINGGYIYARNSSVSTLGKSAHGVQSNAGGSLIDLEKVNIKTEGEASFGLFAAIGSINMTGGTVTTTGQNSSAVYAQKTGNIKLDGTIVKTDGVGSHGIVVSQGGQVTLKDVFVASNGADANGIVFVKPQLEDEGTIYQGTVSLNNSFITAEDGYAISSKNGGIASLSISGGMMAGKKGLYELISSENMQDFNAGLDLVADNGAVVFGRGLVKHNAINTAKPVVNISLSGGSVWMIDGNTSLSNLLLDTSSLTFVQNNFETDQDSFVYLDITGDYRANKASMFFNVGKSAQNTLQTDRIIIHGNVYGQTKIYVKNRGTLDHLEKNNNMNIISVTGSTEYGSDSFSLAGDYRYKGEDVIAGGAYIYRMSYTADDGQRWYLQMVTLGESGSKESGAIESGSGSVTVYGAATPLYETYPQILLALNQTGSMHQRIAARQWIDTALDGAAAQQTGFWIQMDGSTAKFSPGSTTGAGYDVDMVRTKMGLDFGLAENDQGSLIGGLYVQYGHARADISSSFGQGSIKTDGYGLGGTLTWYGNNGFYVDAVAQAMWFDSSIYSRSRHGENGFDRYMAGGNQGFGYLLSLETGKRFEISQSWSVTPQIQLTYNKADFDRFEDFVGGDVRLKNAESLVGRAGLRFEHDQDWIGDDGKARHLKLSISSNLYYDFMDGTKVSVSNVDFHSKNKKAQGGVAAGIDYSWHNGTYALYGELEARSSFNDAVDNYQLAGTVGFRAKF